MRKAVVLIYKSIVVDEVFITRIIRRIYVPTVLDTKKMPSFGTEIPKKGIKQGLSRSIADFGSPYLLYGIVTYRSTTQRGVSLAV